MCVCVLKMWPGSHFLKDDPRYSMMPEVTHFGLVSIRERTTFIVVSYTASLKH